MRGDVRVGEVASTTAPEPVEVVPPVPPEVTGSAVARAREGSCVIWETTFVPSVYTTV